MLDTDERAGGDALRRRRRRRMNAAIERAALEMFASRGFNAVTVEEIAAAVDVSPRTFFRYFPTKEAALHGDPEWRAEQLREALDARPPGEPVVDAMAHGLLTLAGCYEEARDLERLRADAYARVPEIFTAGILSHFRSMAWITQWVAGRRGTDPAADMHATVIASTMIATFYAALWRWFSSGTAEDLPALVGEALDALYAIGPDAR